MEEKKIALLINLRAGKGRPLKVGENIQALLAQKGIDYSIYTESWPTDFQSFTDVWIIGGDGTINYFINHFDTKGVPLSLFKGGTGNDFAWTLYGDMNTEQQVDHVLNAHVKEVDAGNCNGKLFLNGIGIGFDGEVLKGMKAIRLIGGHLGYYLVVLKQIFSFREFSFRISAHKQLMHEKLLLCMINNSSRTGGGFHVSPKSSVNDGLLDLVIAKPLTVLQRLRYLPVIEKGKHLNLPIVKHITGEYFHVACDKELPAQIDGEYFSAQEFIVSVEKEKLAFRY